MTEQTLQEANYGALTAQMFLWKKALEPYENKGLPMKEWQKHRDRIAKEYMKIMLDILIEGI